jgi:hypothetical protein
LGKRRTLARWRELSGDRFEWMRHYLKRTGAPVRFIACPECGCNHRVFPDDDGFHAVCSCEACDCEDILLKPADAEAWLFDPLLFGHDVQSALGTLGEIQPVGGNALDLGGCPKHEKGGHALLLFDIAEDSLKIVPELVVRKNTGCILLSPAMRATEKLLSASEIPIVRIGDVCKSLASGVQVACNDACKRLPRDLSNREVVEQLRPPIYDLCKSKQELTQQVAEKTEEVAQIVTDPTGVVAKIAAGFKNDEDRNLFHLLIFTAEKRGRKRCLSYAEIGDRLDGITKQAVEKRVKVFRRDNPAPWQYVQSVRKPPKERKLSELGPKLQRQKGIDENYGYPD